MLHIINAQVCPTGIRPGSEKKSAPVGGGGRWRLHCPVVYTRSSGMLVDTTVQLAQETCSACPRLAVHLSIVNPAISRNICHDSGLSASRHSINVVRAASGLCDMTLSVSSCGCCAQICIVLPDACLLLATWVSQQALWLQLAALLPALTPFLVSSRRHWLS